MLGQFIGLCVGSKMSKVLFAWELGANFGHLSRDIPVAQKLRETGVQVRFAVRDTRVAGEMLPPHQFEFLQAPICFGRTRLGHQQANYAEMLLAEGWGDRKAFFGYISAWCELLVGGDFDAVVADHAPGVLLAARITGRLAIPLGSGFEIPPDCKPMPTIRPWEQIDQARLLASEQHLLTLINATLTHFGAQPYDRLAEMFALSPVLTTFEELDHYGARNGGCYVGSIHGLCRAPLVSWPSGAGPRVIVYLRAQYKVTSDVIKGLIELGVRAVCVIPEAGEAIKQLNHSQTITILEHPVTLNSLLEEADVVISHGGVGTVAEALLKGVPILMIPITVEQYLLARRVEAIGAGIAIDKKSSREIINKAISELNLNEKYKVRAKMFSNKYAATIPQHSVDHVVRLITEMLTQHKINSLKKIC
ncbi:glycosyltransferase family 1 protein [Aeromonas jandaei]|uniref:glycosyltransferase n=1 Tax=Aeromonas jandaei TaxID=650 RepID=UPI001C5BCB10|nr:nucleotide disphospho-sugar-binding domain-containing protein [Aeromonas jandaei]MBW3805552.1 glycosyltransferase family 1 protein [Aeromonas jandaei]